MTVQRHARLFLLRRLHSLTGVFPIGVFLLEHLWTNAKGLAGQAAFDSAVRDINRLPFLPLLEIFGIFLPLAFHALYGVKLALDGRSNVTRYTYSRNWLYTLQRVTGLLALAFIGWHLWEFRIAKLLGRMSADAFYPQLSAHLSSTHAGVPVLAIVYLVGIGASVLHFANGLWSFSFSWGIFVSRRSQRWFAVVCAVGGLLVFAAGANTTLYFATGARAAGLFEANSSANERCSVVNPATASPVASMPARQAPSAP